ncbi:MAG: hypothetical protein Fur0024_3110 [Patescibacteria group bacterium]
MAYSSIKLPKKFSVAINVFGSENLKNSNENSMESEGTSEKAIQDAASSKAQTVAVFLRSGAVSSKIISLSKTEKVCTAKEKFFVAESAQFSSSITATFSCEPKISKKDLIKLQDSMQKILNDEMSNKWSNEKVVWNIEVMKPSEITTKISKEILYTLAFLSGLLMGIFVSVVFGEEKKSS